MKCTTSTCLVTALLCVLLCLCLTRCAVSDADNDNAVPSAVELELRDEDPSYTGNVLSLVEGTVCKAELPAETVLVPAAEQKQITLSGRKQLLIDSISYCLADGARLSALCSNADMLNASDTLREPARLSGRHLQSNSRPARRGLSVYFACCHDWRGKCAFPKGKNLLIGCTASHLPTFRPGF